MRIGYGLEFHKSDFDAQGLVTDAKRKSQHCFSRSAGIISSEMEIDNEMTSTHDNSSFVHGSFQTVEMMLLLVGVMCYLPCQAWVLQMEIKGRKLLLTTQLQRLMVTLTSVGSNGNTGPIVWPRWQ